MFAPQQKHRHASVAHVKGKGCASEERLDLDLGLHRTYFGVCLEFVGEAFEVEKCESSVKEMSYKM